MGRYRLGLGLVLWPHIVLAPVCTGNVAVCWEFYACIFEGVFFIHPDIEMLTVQAL